MRLPRDVGGEELARFWRVMAMKSCGRRAATCVSYPCGRDTPIGPRHASLRVGTLHAILREVAALSGDGSRGAHPRVVRLINHAAALSAPAIANAIVGAIRRVARFIRASACQTPL